MERPRRSVDDRLRCQSAPFVAAHAVRQHQQLRAAAAAMDYLHTVLLIFASADVVKASGFHAGQVHHRFLAKMDTFTANFVLMIENSNTNQHRFGGNWEVFQ